MHKIISDFDFTVLVPLILVAAVSLWNAIRLRREASWRQDHGVGAARFILVSAGTLIAFIAFLFVGDRVKLQLILGFWFILGLSSLLALICACAGAWDYASKRQWLKFTFCVVVIVLAIASTEHFLDQDRNTRHVLCPTCSDSDSEN